MVSAKDKAENAVKIEKLFVYSRTASPKCLDIISSGKAETKKKENSSLL